MLGMMSGMDPERMKNASPLIRMFNGRKCGCKPQRNNHTNWSKHFSFLSDSFDEKRGGLNLGTEA